MVEIIWVGVDKATGEYVKKYTHHYYNEKKNYSVYFTKHLGKARVFHTEKQARNGISVDWLQSLFPNCQIVFRKFICEMEK